MSTMESFMRTSHKKAGNQRSNFKYELTVSGMDITTCLEANKIRLKRRGWFLLIREGHEHSPHSELCTLA